MGYVSSREMYDCMREMTYNLRLNSYTNLDNGIFAYNHYNKLCSAIPESIVCLHDR